MIALCALFSVLVIGTIGYVLLGIDLLDAMYQTVTTVTTIGFREVVEFGTAEKIFTMVLALAGVGTVLYTLTLTLELVLEGQLGNLWGRRRMQRDIDALEGHAIVCGWGRVGRAAAEQIAKNGQQVVVVDASEERLETCPYPHVLGDATQDDVLRAAGIRTASTPSCSMMRAAMASVSLRRTLPRRSSAACTVHLASCAGSASARMTSAWRVPPLNASLTRYRQSCNGTPDHPA